MTELCTCEAIDYTECQCSLADSDCIQIDGSGSASVPFSAVPIIDPDDDNLVSCAGDGLLVETPSHLRAPPRVQAYHNANQSMVTDVSTVVALNSERYDVGDMHSTTTNNSRLTFTTAGIYVVTFLCSFAGNTAGDRRALIRKNGAETIGGSEKKALSSATPECGISVTVQEWFQVNEYVEATVKQDSGGSINLLATRYSPILSAVFRRRSP
jgi:hypothetical protein